MILGRPTNLWLGLVTGGLGALGTTLIVLGADPQAVGLLLGAYGTMAGAVIALVAGQPPTLSPGDHYNVNGPDGSQLQRVIIRQGQSTSRVGDEKPAEAPFDPSGGATP